MSQERQKSFSCGCCGSYFRSLPSIQKQFDQDDGHGTCPDCAEYIDARAEEDWVKLETKVAESFNVEANRQKFLSMELALRRGLILKMIEDGIITYSIGGK